MGPSHHMGVQRWMPRRELPCVAYMSGCTHAASEFQGLNATSVSRFTAMTSRQRFVTTSSGSHQGTDGNSHRRCLHGVTDGDRQYHLDQTLMPTLIKSADGAFELVTSERGRPVNLPTHVEIAPQRGAAFGRQSPEALEGLFCQSCKKWRVPGRSFCPGIGGPVGRLVCIDRHYCQ